MSVNGVRAAYDEWDIPSTPSIVPMVVVEIPEEPMPLTEQQVMEALRPSLIPSCT